jgi:hypothetical protein
MSRVIVQAGIRTAIGSVFLCAILFIAAGDLSWPAAWAFSIALVLSSITPLIGPFQLDEGLIEERMHPKPSSKRWDKYFVGVVALFTIVELVVPGLDHRWGRALRRWMQGQTRENPCEAVENKSRSMASSIR